MRVPIAESRDCGENAFTRRERRFGLEPQPRPRIRPRPGSRRPADDLLACPEVRVERLRARSRQAPLRLPEPQQRDDEVSTRIGAHELDRMVPLAEPDLDSVCELPLKRLAARPVGTDSAKRRLHRQPARLVERDQTSHVRSLTPHNARVCAAVIQVCANSKWHSAPVPFVTPPNDPRLPCSPPWRVGSTHAPRRAANGTRSQCHLTASKTGAPG